MMAALQRLRARAGADLFALGCSTAVHGVAVAALVALHGGSPPEQPPPPPVAVAMVWSVSAAPALENPAAAANTSPAPAADPPTIGVAPPDPSAAFAEHGATDLPSAMSLAALRDPPPRKPRAPEQPTTIPPSPRGERDGAVSRLSARGAAMDSPTGESSQATRSGPASGAAAPPPWSVSARVPPVYPMSARRRGIEGDVSLRVDIGADGNPRMVAVLYGSGDPQLDGAAVRAVEQWRFAVAAPMVIEIPIQFRLSAHTAETSPR